MAALAAATMLAACTDGARPGQAQPVQVEGFFGAVSADEPQAAQVGRDILTAGGSAADAAAGMFFALSATLPSAASLGAGGACLVHDPRTRKTEALLFPATALPAPRGGAAPSVPGAVRAMTLLHARGGSLRWEQVVAGGERLARIGAPVSRALARDLQGGAAAIGADPAARRIYDRGGGVAIGEGDVFVQNELAGTLGAIRARGGVDFFQGPQARQIADAYTEAGAPLTLEALRNAVPRVVEPIAVPWGNHTAYFVPAPFGGEAARAAWSAGPQAGGGGSAGAAPGVAAFVAVDRNAGAVACAVGMGQLFGVRRVAPGTGIMIGAAAGRDEALAPMIVSNRNTGDVFLAGAGSGDAAAPAALGRAAAQVLQGRSSVRDALGASPALLNLVACTKGLRSDRSSCQVATDPKGFGLALGARER